MKRWNGEEGIREREVEGTLLYLRRRIRERTAMQIFSHGGISNGHFLFGEKSSPHQVKV